MFGIMIVKPLTSETFFFVSDLFSVRRFLDINLILVSLNQCGIEILPVLRLKLKGLGVFF